jgi:hypothetical protein
MRGWAELVGGVFTPSAVSVAPSLLARSRGMVQPRVLALPCECTRPCIFLAM